MMNRIIVLLLAMTWTFSLSAANPNAIRLEGGDASQLVTEFEVLQDSMGAFKLGDIRSSLGAQLLLPYQAETVVIPRGKNVYWIHFSLLNAGTHDGEWTLNFGFWSYVDLYLLRNDSLETHHTGVFYPYRKRSYQLADRCALLAKLKQGETVECWVRLDNRGNYDYPPGGIWFEAAPRAISEAEESRSRAIIYLFTGIFLAMFFYNLFVFFVTKDRTYLYYLGSVLGYLVFTLLNSGYINSIFWFIEGLPGASTIYPPFISILVVSTTLLFVGKFLDVPKRYKTWNKIFWGLIIAIVLGSALRMVNYELGGMINDLVALGMLICLMVVSIKASLDKVPGAVYLLLAQIFVVLGTTVTILAASGVIPLNDFTGKFSMPLGSCIEMILFSFALGNKINILRKENEQKQARIIGQLRENEELQQKVNLELEEKVKERTQEIIAQRKLVEEVQVALEREKSEKAIQQALLEKDKAEASEKMKKQFFAQMTHEFRTPLTLIMGPLEEIETDTKDGKTRQHARFALRNSKILLRLINQILGLSRLEEGFMDIRPERLDLAEFAGQRVEAFQNISAKKQLKLSFTSTTKALDVDFDPDMMEKVLNNLLSNAVKFTPLAGEITVRLGEAPENKARITIRDTGIGIPEEKLPFIFDRFYRVDGEKHTDLEGTGLGLPLARELVRLHGGEIRVSSLEGLGSEFSVLIPRKQEGVQEGKPSNYVPSMSPELERESIPLPNKADDSWDMEDDHENVLLLVEDNPDVRDYVRMSLEPAFKVIEAVNGLEGIARAKEYVPDLIISDVMMPGANGFEVCKAVKEHKATSHIPVIMLTARTALDDRIVGLETGADAYLSKPFNTKELKVQVRNLIDNRSKLRERYRKEMLTSPVVTEATSVEEQFLIRLKEALAVDLANDKFSVEDLAEAMAMSRTQLHRKLKALTGQAASEFIRNYRLEYAYQLLEQKAGSVGEVAFQVGFSSSSYFSKAFSAKYGLSPKEVRKKGN